MAVLDRQSGWMQEHWAVARQQKMNSCAEPLRCVLLCALRVPALRRVPATLWCHIFTFFQRRAFPASHDADLPPPDLSDDELSDLEYADGDSDSDDGGLGPVLDYLAAQQAAQHFGAHADPNA